MDVYPAIGHLNLLTELISTLVLAIKDQIHMDILHVRHAHSAREVVGQHVPHMGLIGIIGQQHPMLVFPKAKNVCLLVQLYFVGLLGVCPGRIAAAADFYGAIV